jgi:hypothetical protein
VTAWISRLDFRLPRNIHLAPAAQIVEIGHGPVSVGMSRGGDSSSLVSRSLLDPFLGRPLASLVLRRSCILVGPVAQKLYVESTALRLQ